MKDFDKLHFFLNIEIYTASLGSFLNQDKYALDRLDKVGMIECALVPLLLWLFHI